MSRRQARALAAIAGRRQELPELGEPQQGGLLDGQAIRLRSRGESRSEWRRPRPPSLPARDVLHGTERAARGCCIRPSYRPAAPTEVPEGRKVGVASSLGSSPTGSVVQLQENSSHLPRHRTPSPGSPGRSSGHLQSLVVRGNRKHGPATGRGKPYLPTSSWRRAARVRLHPCASQGKTRARARSPTRAVSPF